MEGFLFYVTVFHSYPLLNFYIDFFLMFTLNFFAAQTRRLQRSSEEGRSPQSRPVGKLALCRSGRPQNLLMWQESWVAEGAEGVFTEAVPTGL